MAQVVNLAGGRLDASQFVDQQNRNRAFAFEQQRELARQQLVRANQIRQQQNFEANLRQQALANNQRMAMAGQQAGTDRLKALLAAGAAAQQRDFQAEQADLNRASQMDRLQMQQDLQREQFDAQREDRAAALVRSQAESDRAFGLRQRAQEFSEKKFEGQEARRIEEKKQTEERLRAQARARIAAGGFKFQINQRSKQIKTLEKDIELIADEGGPGAADRIQSLLREKHALQQENAADEQSMLNTANEADAALVGIDAPQADRAEELGAEDPLLIEGRDAAFQPEVRALMLRGEEKRAEADLRERHREAQIREIESREKKREHDMRMKEEAEKRKASVDAQLSKIKDPEKKLEFIDSADISEEEKELLRNRLPRRAQNLRAVLLDKETGQRMTDEERLATADVIRSGLESTKGKERKALRHEFRARNRGVSPEDAIRTLEKGLDRAKVLGAAGPTEIARTGADPARGRALAEASGVDTEDLDQSLKIVHSLQPYWAENLRSQLVAAAREASGQDLGDTGKRKGKAAESFQGEQRFPHGMGFAVDKITDAAEAKGMSVDEYRAMLRRLIEKIDSGETITGDDVFAHFGG